MVNFEKELKKKRTVKSDDPIDIYNLSDRKSVTGPLRPAQQSILNQWYTERKDEKDLIVKLHTGQGKTLIGLLILQSYLNSNEGPCMYICPNKYLVEQVCEEASKFGINYCKVESNGDIPDDYLTGDKILITHSHKVFNGMSIFSKYPEYHHAGAIILDDSHACIETIKDSLSITIKRNENSSLYRKLLTLFEEDLKEQGEGSYIDVRDNIDQTLLPIPYWTWKDKKDEILEILSSYREDKQVKFTWPFIKDSLKNYDCYITGEKIEITPYSHNINNFPILSRAKKRILMSATTQDDSFFIKGLDLSVDAVKSPLLFNEQKWSGEKMIILPSLIDDSMDRTKIVNTFADKKFTDYGVVSLTPSTKKAKHYEHLGSKITTSENIFHEVDKLKNGIFNELLVVNNRYDGIDLPDEACRILIVDSLPYQNTLAFKYEESARKTSELINKRIAQKIEQGLGRAVRGEKDYCIVLVIGTDIVRFLRSPQTRKYFSEQTRKQLEIGLKISELAKEENEENLNEDPIELIRELTAQSLNRDSSWKQFYMENMEEIKTDFNTHDLYEKIKIEKKVESHFLYDDYHKAIEEIQKLINNTNDDLEKSWYKQQLAKMYYYHNNDEFNDIQKSAFVSNTQLLKPKFGITYNKISYINEGRISKIREFITLFESFEHLYLSITELFEDISFGMESNKFEDGIKRLGELLGFISQRPDNEIRKGPDNLWCVGKNQYFLFECKNQVEMDRYSIHKKEAGQVNSHCAWFESEYGEQVHLTSFMIIPTKQLSYDADFSSDVKIIRKQNLNKLKDNVYNFISNLHRYNLDAITDSKINELLERNKLDIESLRIHYCEDFYHLPQ